MEKEKKYLVSNHSQLEDGIYDKALITNSQHYRAKYIEWFKV
jgi:hypothetical protein